MRRTSKLLFTLEDGPGPVHQRLYRRMRSLIIEGTWPPGTKLPSSRALAEELGLSRNTALHALELLVADGWAQGRRGAAMHVSADVPKPVHPTGHARTRGPARLPVPFEMGWHTAEFFPVERWNRLQLRLMDEAGTEILYGSEPGGLPQLREAIANYVGGARALSADPNQVVVVSGTQAGIDLITRVVGDAGSRIWVEDPGYPPARDLFRTNGLVVVPVAVDQGGLCVDDGIATAADARLAYVTPACHFPTGRHLASERRRTLLDWAERHQTWVIEDDWEWHANFAGAAQAPLYAEPGGDRVIYIQTFNRTMFPGLRLAFIIAPKELAGAMVEFQQKVDGGPNVAVQAMLAHFLEDGLYAAHLRMTRAAYTERRDVLIRALEGLPTGFKVEKDRAGLHLVVSMPDGADDAAVASAVRQHGIACMALSEFASSASRERALVLGFAAFKPAQLEMAADGLIGILSELSARRSSEGAGGIQ